MLLSKNFDIRGHANGKKKDKENKNPELNISSFLAPVRHCIQPFTEAVMGFYAYLHPDESGVILQKSRELGWF